MKVNVTNSITCDMNGIEMCHRYIEILKVIFNCGKKPYTQLF